MIRGHLIVSPPLHLRLPDWVPAEMPCIVPFLPPGGKGTGPTTLGFRPLGEREVHPLVRSDPEGGYTALADLTALADFIRSEHYRTAYRPFYSRLPLPAHRLPRRLKAAAYRVLSAGSRRRRPDAFVFPAWPKDMSADTLTLFGAASKGDKSAGGNKSIFKIDPGWPEGKAYAVVLTHDVDSGWAFEYTENVAPLLDIESSAGVRSAWYFVVDAVPSRELLTRGLERNGHEIGFHCYNHDHRFPFLSESQIRKRLERCRPFLERFQVKGFRSANYLKSPRYLEIMSGHFEYDLSFRDSYHGAGGALGCSTVFPFTRAGCPLLEIPTTIPEDYDLFARGLSAQEALRVQLDAIENIKRRGGVVNIVTHAEPHLSVNEEGLSIYKEVVRSLAADSSAWITLPRDLAAWWRTAISSSS